MSIRSRFILYTTSTFISLVGLGLTSTSFAKETSYAPVSITKTFAEIMKEDMQNKSALGSAP